MATFDEILATANDPAYVRVVTARISFVSQALRDEHGELDARLKQLRKERDTVDISDEEIETAERIAAIEAETESATQEFRFGCVGHRAWRDLLRDHPPTKEQLEAHRQIDQRQALDYNPDTFPHEAMAASCLEPKMTPDQVRQLEGLPTIDLTSWLNLWTACVQANVAAASPKSMAAAGLIARLNGGSDGRVTSLASHAVSSSDAS